MQLDCSLISRNCRGTMFPFPKKLITLNNLHNPDSYICDLKQCPYFEKYLWNICKKLIVSCSNPMATTLVRDYFDNNLEYYDACLKLLVSSIGEGNMESIISELMAESYPHTENFEKKLASIEGEIVCFTQLSSLYPNLRKINFVGDWENDQVLVSVKTVLAEDFNYHVIENCLISLFYIEELSLIRNYEIRVTHGNNIDDKFLSEVLLYMGKSAKYLGRFRCVCI